MMMAPTDPAPVRIYCNGDAIPKHWFMFVIRHSWKRARSSERKTMWRKWAATKGKALPGGGLTVAFYPIGSFDHTLK
jgi:hypothetical protein